MDNLDFSAQDGLFSMNADYTMDNRVHGMSSMPAYLQPGWPMTTDVLDEEEEMHRAVDASGHQTSAQQAYSAAIPRRHNTPTTSPITLQQTTGVGLGLAQNMNDPSSLWQFQYQPHSQNNYSHDAFSDSSYDDCSFVGPFNSSPVGGVPLATRAMQLPLQVSTATNPMGQYLTMAGPMESMGALAYPLNDYSTGLMSFPMSTMGGLLSAQTQAVTSMANPIIPGGSPSSSTFEVCSLSSSDNGWNAINYAQHNFGDHAAATTHAVFNPGETLHIRADSNSSSDGSQADQLSGSYEDMPFPMHSPISEHNTFDSIRGYGIPRLMTDHHQHGYCDHDCSAVQSPDETSPAVSPSSVNVKPVANVRSRPLSSSSASTSPTGTSPPMRRRRSPTGSSAIAKTTKSAIKKAEPNVRKSAAGGSEKRVGRRRGPLRPDQRQQAHEIRKLRACLRCKFLKKTCDKGDPCAGCRPSHARLWQVPCTRIDIKDIGFFINDWEYDYKRHVTLGFSVNNVKGFSQAERTLYITHGFGYYLPIAAREVYVVDENCFEVDWIETANMTQYEASTSKLSTGIAGVSAAKLSEYIDMHLDNGFDQFVDQYFEGTPFLTQILHTAYKYYTRTQTPVIRKALKLILAYTLTLHITMVVGMTEEEQAMGRIDDDSSRFSGKTIAPVMINFEVKCALAKMWRELQKDVLEELSSLYSSVYQGDKLRHWPTIFMVASILLAVWELMQFDCHYREPDEKKVEKFCSDMESTPVGVIVGLFQAISQKLPSFMEWDSKKHSAALNNDQPICDALTEVRSHVEEHEDYLRKRPDTKFTRDDFDSLSNKFLSKLVIRAN
ncbi:hypothetical protein KVT40_004878 [Elsinoe batatas]|uniref:C6 finger domain protein n=1 Tax=Elsinoe batatas TaxID=2601811 RepID=A0A8K0L1W1_9PEZI|nr:hypothetical protein KVT40_004878 [Elsinoe batatas]